MGVEALHSRFLAGLRDRDGAPPPDAGVLRLLEKTPRNSLRVGFLDAVFPDALFVYLHREPGPTIASMMGVRARDLRCMESPGCRGEGGWSPHCKSLASEMVAAGSRTETRDVQNGTVCVSL